MALLALILDSRSFLFFAITFSGVAIVVVGGGGGGYGGNAIVAVVILVTVIVVKTDGCGLWLMLLVK